MCIVTFFNILTSSYACVVFSRVQFLVPSKGPVAKKAHLLAKTGEFLSPSTHLCQLKYLLKGKQLPLLSNLEQ